MAALTPVASVEALLNAIRKSGLLAGDKFEKVRQAAAQVTDPKQLARDLIRDATLTKWQAGQLLHGYHALVIGKYKLLDELATTPTGRIYLVEHAQIGRRHTLKVLARRLASNPQAVKQFLASAQNACGLDHRNISHVYDVNQDGDRHYVVMEYVEGQDLERMVERGGPVKLAEALDFVAQAAEGLAHAHENGVVHGDLKPSNLLRDKSATIKILEIGQTGTGATFEAEGADESIEMAALAAVVFQAPELRGDGEVADVACDVYSLGSVLSFLLTGKAAADAAAAAEQLRARGDIPNELIELCSRLMADKPADRPRTMAAVLEQLAAATRSLTSPKNKAEAQQPPPVIDKTEKTPTKDVPSSPKQKKPPLAKALDHEGSTPIIIPGETGTVLEPEPLGPIVIKTRGRAGKQPAAQTVKAAKPAEPAAKEPTATDESPAEATTKATYTPLIIAGAIGGGGVLVLGLIIALVCLLAFSRGNKPVASNKAKASSPAAKTAPLAPAAPESNPERTAGEKNPEVSPAPGSDDAPAVAGTAPPAPAAKSSETSARAATSSAGKESSAEPAAASPSTSAASEVKKEPPAEPKPETKPQPPPEPKPAAKPAAPKTAPKQESKPEPFKGLPKAVSLPELPDQPGQPASEAAATLVLGPCKLDDKAVLIATLLGGDSAIRASRQKFDLQPRAGSTRDWDFVLTGGAAPVAIAGLSAKDGNLLFQWTDEGLKQAPLAKQLGNCALNLLVGPDRHVLALRMPQQGPPLTVEIDKPGASIKWNIGELPVAKQLFIEVTGLETIKVYRSEPKGPVNVGESITVWIGATEKSMPLALKLNTSSTARSVDVKLLPHYKLEGQDPHPYRKKEMLALQSQVENELPFLAEQLEQAKRDRPSTNPVKAVIEKKQIDDRKAALTVQVTQRMAMRDQINYLAGFTDTFQATAQIHFRVYSQAGDAKIDLLRTQDEPPPATAKAK